MKVAVIGAGKMGRWFVNLFKNEGFSVVVSSRTQSKADALKAEFGVDVANSNVEAVVDADWILVCVSLTSLDTVLQEIGPLIKEGQVVMDISSIKEIPVNLLQKYVKHGVTLGTHPVFGPGAKSLQGQNYVLTPVTENEKLFSNEFKEWLQKRGSEVSVLTPRAHDELMSLVLGFPHFVGLVAGDALVENSNFVGAKKVGGATYKLLLTLAESVSSEEPHFYSNLHMSLPEMEQLEALFLNKVEEWLKLVKNKNCAGFSSKMEQVKKRLKELDPDYESAYQAMYRILGDS
ncbi:MAG TPA: prephenate dehydrogenase/arogenate dehydrogenase family protein [Candidatus Bathyarchaeota archaeon]|mgnify:CR=1 FL=1|nr:prephenate dehydrogenase/arogenate dehydrogenase family protein [Candidatus Bathyarchaeota archaeon]